MNDDGSSTTTDSMNREALSVDQLRPGSRWKHWKGGSYTLVCCGFIEATGEACVIYRSDLTEKTWVRPTGNFLGQVKQEGQLAFPRFVLEDIR